MHIFQPITGGLNTTNTRVCFIRIVGRQVDKFQRCVLNVADPDPAKNETADKYKFYCYFQAFEFWTLRTVGLFGIVDSSVLLSCKVFL